jgi:2-desacetyl-2-hydroxyethyl bacteriochlorophyllide A dehydrogenase
VGHEFCGRVVEICGDSAGIRVGDRVTLYPLISCGRCYVCRNGNPHVCRMLRLYGIDTEGGMAGFVKAPARQLIKIPESMQSAVGALLEPFAVGLHAVSRVSVRAGDTAVVLGGGPIGLITALSLRLAGVQRIFISELQPFRLQLARSLGFTAVNAGGVAEVVRETTGGEGADVLFECAGYAPVALQMTDLVRPRGVIVNVGVFKKPVEVNLLAVNFKELSIVGSRVYAMSDFERAVELAPSVPLVELVTHQFPLARVTEAFATFKAGENVCKVLVEP